MHTGIRVGKDMKSIEEHGHDSVELWKERLDEVELSRSTMDEMVQEWLELNAYNDLSTLLMAETHRGKPAHEEDVATGVDRHLLHQRDLIRRLLSRGLIRAVIENCNELNPDVSNC